jgi:hypothetical protein
MNRTGTIARATLGALRQLRFSDLEECLRKACAVFPDGDVPTHGEAVDQTLAELPVDALECLDALDTALLTIRDVDARLLEFLRQHRDDILRPERGLVPGHR